MPRFELQYTCSLTGTRVTEQVTFKDNKFGTAEQWMEDYAYVACGGTPHSIIIVEHDAVPAA